MVSQRECVGGEALITLKNGKPFVPSKPIKKKRTHLIAQPFTGSFSDPDARFTKANFMYHLNLGHSAVDERMKTSWRRMIPPPDGYSPFAWWRPATVLEYFATIYRYRSAPPIILLRLRGHPEFDFLRPTQS